MMGSRSKPTCSALVLLLGLLTIRCGTPVCLGSGPSDVPPELRRVVIRDTSVGVFDGKQKLGEATWGECYGVSQQKEGWLWVQSKDGVAKKRFIRGWVTRESVVPEKDAEELFLTARRERPADPLPPFFLALHSLRRKDADQSLRFADEAIRLAPKAPLPHVARAQALQLKGDLDQAHAECQAALKIDSKSAAAYYCLGDILSDQKRFKEAIDPIQHAQKRDPSDPAIARLLASLHANLNDFANAMQAIDKAISLAPDRGSYYYFRSSVEWKTHELDAASKDIAIADRLDPDESDNKIGLSMLLEVSGDMRAAYELTIRGCDCKPGLYDRQRRLIQTLQRDDAAPALMRLQAWAAEPPQTPDKYVQTARAYAMCGDWAVRWLY